MTGAKKKSPVLVMIIMLVSMTAGATCMNKVGPVLTDICNDLNITTAQSGLLVSIFVLSGIFLSIPMGVLTAKYGTFKTGLFSLICLVVGAAMGAVSTGYGMMMVSRFLEGIGLMFLLCIGPPAVGKTATDTNRGTLMGIVMCFMSFGQIIALNIAPAVGWRTFWWISAAIAGVGLVLWIIYIRDIDADEQPAEAAEVSVEANSSVSDVLKNGSVWMIALTFLAFMLAHMGAFNFLPTYLTEVGGLSATKAGSLVSLASAIGIPVGIFGGWLADKWGSRKKPLALTMIFLGVLLFAMPLFTAKTYVVALVLYGFFAMAEAGLCMTSISEVVPPSQGASATGVVNTGQWIGAFLGSTLFGAILGATNWDTSFRVMAVIAVLGAVATLSAKKLK